MHETLLLVELEAQEFSVDLRALSQLVLSDLGATLLILRLAGCEHGNAEGRPARMVDCISDIGVPACIEAMSAQLAMGGGRSAFIAELWSHSSEIARHSKRIAEATVDIDPDQAYLVGMCHSIGLLPDALGWDVSKRQGLDSVPVGLELARAWTLPSCVIDYFRDLQMCGGQSPWPEIVQAAHRCAGQTSIDCSSREDLRPQLLRAV
jgi:hypothetical protein